MNFSEYLDLAAVNWSTLKEARKSLRHYKHRLENKREDTTALAIGRAAHTAVFEPDRFLIDYALWDGGDRRGKAYSAFCEQHPDQTVLKTEEYARALAMRDAVRSHAVAGPLLTPPGEAEKVLLWTDETTGIGCKARLDWWRPGLLADLKTTGNLDPHWFATNAYRMGYFGQLAFYLRALAANKLDAPPPKIIAVEANAPHDVAVFGIDDDALWAGDVEVADLLSKVAAGRFSREWPGAYPEEVPLSMPAWALPSDDDGGFGLTVGTEAA